MTDNEDLEIFVEETIEDNSIVIFMKGNERMPRCGYSEKALVLVANNTDEEIVTVDVLGDHLEDFRDALESYSDRSTIPQVFVNDEFVGGSDILEQLEERGELEQTLEVDNQK